MKGGSVRGYIAAFVLGAVLALAGAYIYTSGTIHDLRERASDYREQHRRAEERIEALEAKLNEANIDIGKLTKELERILADIEKIRGYNRRLRKAIEQGIEAVRDIAAENRAAISGIERASGRASTIGDIIQSIRDRGRDPDI